MSNEIEVDANVDNQAEQDALKVFKWLAFACCGFFIATMTVVLGLFD